MKSQTIRKHTIAQPPSLPPVRQTEPGSAEALTSVFTVEGQCLLQTVRQHILLHIESPLFSLPNKYVGGGVGGRGGGGAAGEEMEEVSKRHRGRESEKRGTSEPYMSRGLLTLVPLRKLPMASSVVKM